MIVNAIIVEQLEHDGFLRSFRMWAQPGRPLTVGFPDEHDSGSPFYFPDEQDEQVFEKGFAECRAGRLPKSRFITVDGDGVFRNSWSGIPTERGSLSFYALSLPEFAVPTRVEFKDPHSGRLYSCTVIRDDRSNRFVLYLGCRSSRGTFDFSLHVSFRNDRGGFRSAEYSDQHTTNRSERIPPYEDFLPPDQRLAVAQFFSEGTALQASHSHRESERSAHCGQKSEPLDKLPAKTRDMSRHFAAVKLTDRQQEVASLRFEYALPVAAIARRLRLDRKTIQEHLDAATTKLSASSSPVPPIEQVPDPRRNAEEALLAGDLATDTSTESE